MTAEKTWTVNAIKDAVRAAGSHWFDPDTMRTFGTKVLPEVYQGPGGVFFVTHDDRFDRSKGYTVRQFTPEDSGIGTFGELAGHDSRAEAVQAARDAAGKDSHVQIEQFKPVSVRDQFAHDLQKHTNPDRGTETRTVKAADRLIRLARRHHRLAEQQCNGEGAFRDWDGESDPSPYDDVRERIRAEAGQIGCAGVVFSGDPRGATVKLTFADGFTNDWGKEGYCVPTGEGE